MAWAATDRNGLVLGICADAYVMESSNLEMKCGIRMDFGGC